jgi:hypothetical protein
VVELTFEIGVRSFGGLGFEADGEGCGFDPAGEEVEVRTQEWVRHRCVGYKGREDFTQTRGRPEAGFRK